MHMCCQIMDSLHKLWIVPYTVNLESTLPTLHMVERRKFYRLDKKYQGEYVYCCSCNTKKKFVKSLGDFIDHSIPGKSNCLKAIFFS